ncbi:MAG: DUF1853 family protein [Oxalicibacterium faecigallinarum]|uniref:DUF1853 family protein n=1 Tax=Oxalicibacterium faecigallinarum TaxID=573741 RepID=UPI002806C0D5|nr:DUF1853 family protein [Oxalicibacterium faecigallinarum]MDQ7969222.1 DUF1853 family protein [Oxalicibacterium faecigallinarum]
MFVSHNFQREFHQRWSHLTHPHVRGLAWLLDAPDLLDQYASQWHGQIATLSQVTGSRDINTFLTALDQQPAPLLASLEINPFTRLGRYAEALMAFYLREEGLLVQHGLQVRADKNSTIGEFDFLLRLNDALVHWEFATKFYLLESSGAGHDADYFVGPNLADTLGAKMNKIFARQLHLSRHPAAQALLPEPVATAQALVKGWLFYKDGDSEQTLDGLNAAHCRGFWATSSDLFARADIDGMRFAVLHRLAWLAPARMSLDHVLSADAMADMLQAHFVDETMPVMVALMEVSGEEALEVERGFIVPDDWRTRAGQRIGLSRQQS